LYKEFSLYDAV